MTISGGLLESLAPVGVAVLLSGGLAFPMLALSLLPISCLFVGFNYASKYENYHISGRIIFILSGFVILTMVAAVIGAIAR
jgi:hypothetical protein